MTDNRINIDQIVDYRAAYSQAIQRAQISGDGGELTGLCPFHKDDKRSFSANLKTGQWHCFAEDIGGNYLDFYARVHGLADTGEAYKEILREYHIDSDFGHEAQKPAGNTDDSYTLERYAADKKLPQDWLEETFHLSTEWAHGAQYLRIPYYSESGAENTYRKRYAGKEFRWKRGTKTILYGEWLLSKIRKAGYVLIVEGESDTQSLWYMGIPALGVPGASNFKPEMTQRLSGIARVYVHKEPDKGGDTFLRKVPQGLAAGGYNGEVYAFSCSACGPYKDPSDLYMSLGREAGAAKIKELLSAAERLDLGLEAEMALIPGEPAHLSIPDGWDMSERGIYKIGRDGEEKLVCRTPILLVRRMHALDTGAEKIEIAFYRDKTWRTAMFPRSTVFTARGITALADMGCTVTSENAKDLVSFMAALEAENIDRIERVDSVSSFGWQPGGRFIPGSEKGIVLDADPSQSAQVSGFVPSGSLDEWVALMKPYRDKTPFRFILAAAFAAPLLKIVRCRSFFVYIWGNSRSGKTAALKAALSAWGDPECLMVNFNATQVGLERTAALYRDIPLGIDERQLAGKNQGSLERVIYMISNETGKVRGTKNGGTQPARKWRTIAISTGEEPAAKGNTQDGVDTRIIEISDKPFASEKEAARMHEGCGQVYGTAGIEFVKWLTTLSENDIQTKYDEMRRYIGGVSSGEAGSHIAAIAAIALADAMIDTLLFRQENVQAGELTISAGSWTEAQKMAKSILGGIEKNRRGDVNERAVQHITDWVLSGRANFGSETSGVCYGLISKNKEGKDIAYIFPSIFERELEDYGYSYKKTINYMVENGYVTPGSKTGQPTVNHWFNGSSPRFVAFNLWKVEGACAGESEITDIDKNVSKQKDQESIENLPDLGVIGSDLGGEWYSGEDLDLPF